MVTLCRYVLFLYCTRNAKAVFMDAQFSLKFLDITLSVLRLEVSVYDVYIQTSFKPILVKVTVETFVPITSRNSASGLIPGGGDPLQKGQCHEMDVFLKGLNILISTFCVSADGFQGLSKAFRYPIQLSTFYLLLCLLKPFSEFPSL
jgi:hypothetical protein